MSKNRDKSVTEAPAAPPAPTTAPEVVAAEVVPVTETAMVVAAPAALEKVCPIDEKLAAFLPAGIRARLDKEVRPTSEDMEAAVAALPPDLQEKFHLLLERINPEKEGDFSGRPGFSTAIMKIYQGTGNDQNRPEECGEGQFYTANAQIFKGPIDIVLLMAWSGRTLWPKRGEEDGGSKGPLCHSYDNVHGDKWGDCETCDFSGMKYNDGGCSRGSGIIFTDKDFSGLYEAVLDKTSYSVGARLLKQARAQTNLWDRTVRIGSSKEVNKEKNYKWYTWTAQLTQEQVDLKVQRVLMLLSRWIRLDTHYTRIARTYMPRAQQEPQAPQAPEGGPIDTLTKGSATADGNADFSTKL